MKRFFRLFLLTLLVCAPLSLFAQSGARYGYLNRAAVIALLPETARVRAQLDSLRAKYEAEARYNETAFRRQYSEYLQVQKKFARGHPAQTSGGFANGHGTWHRFPP